MPDIHITVQEKTAHVLGNPEIVCGNADYSAVFLFDAEWDAYETKTARFVFAERGIPQYRDVLFSGNTVQIPAVYGTCRMLIGVYAGDIRTTTGAEIACVPCITDGQPVHPDPPPDVYAQLMQLLRSLDKDDRAPVLAAAQCNAFAPCAAVRTEREE